MLLVAIVTASCGAPDSVDRAASNGEDQVTDTVVRVAQEIVGITDSTPPVTVVLGGVTVDDPLPPQADAATDPAIAEDAVRYAYRHWILVDLDPALRGRLIENGDASADRIAEGFEAARSIAEYARIEVDTVTFPEPDRAQLTFRIRWQDNASPYFPNPLVGEAVFRDGTWRVSRRVLCLLAIGSGQDCAAEGPNPTSPSAFTAPGIPVGYTWAGTTEPDGAVSTEGFIALWMGPGQVMISARSIVGASKVDPADIGQLLQAAGRFGVVAPTPVEVGTFPGVITTTSRSVHLTFLRDDDVIVDVQLDGGGLTADDALAIATSLEPSDDVPTPRPVPEGDFGVTVTTALAS